MELNRHACNVLKSQGAKAHTPNSLETVLTDYWKQMGGIPSELQTHIVAELKKVYTLANGVKAEMKSPHPDRKKSDNMKLELHITALRLNKIHAQLMIVANLETFKHQLGQFKSKRKTSLLPVLWRLRTPFAR